MNLLVGAEAEERNTAVWRKYLTAEGIADEAVGGAIRRNDDTTIRFAPDRWRTWGTDSDFGGAFERPGVTLPLGE
jgi:hypothetical protein